MGLDNPIHLMFLLVVLLLVFGAKRLPELGHSLGTGLRGFKEAIGGESPIASMSATAQPQAQPQSDAQTRTREPVSNTPSPAHLTSVQPPAGAATGAVNDNLA
jgi:sec-independent protein translocase protein TatA